MSNSAKPVTCVCGHTFWYAHNHFETFLLTYCNRCHDTCVLTVALALVEKTAINSSAFEQCLMWSDHLCCQLDFLSSKCWKDERQLLTDEVKSVWWWQMSPVLLIGLKLTSWPAWCWPAWCWPAWCWPAWSWPAWSWPAWCWPAWSWPAWSWPARCWPAWCWFCCGQFALKGMFLPR